MKNWTWDDYDTLRKLYPTQGYKVCDIIGKGGKMNVDTRASKFGMIYNRPYTQEELDLASKFGASVTCGLMFFLPERSPTEIQGLLACVNVSVE